MKNWPIRSSKKQHRPLNKDSCDIRKSVAEKLLPVDHNIIVMYMCRCRLQSSWDIFLKMSIVKELNFITKPSAEYQPSVDDQSHTYSLNDVRIHNILYTNNNIPYTDGSTFSFTITK